MTTRARVARILRAPLVLALLVAGVALVRLYRPPRGASNLVIVPDSVEYAVSAQRFATLGRCDLEIEGVAYPPRYPPWFPVAVLSPAYALAPGEIGAGVVPVLLFGVAGVLGAFAIGQRLAGAWGGAASAAALAGDFLWGIFSREIMADVPAAVLVVWACWLFVSMAKAEPPAKRWLVAGLVCAAAAAIRTEATATVLPFLVLALRRRPLAQKFAASSLVLLPLVALVIGTAVYQRSAFGDWRRNGYMFWCPVPCDYASLSFSLDYATHTLALLNNPDLIVKVSIALAGVAVLLARRSTGTRSALLFLALAVLPGTLMHVFFFAAQIRFYLPPIVLLWIVGAAGLAAIVPERFRARAPLVPPLIALIPLALPRLPNFPPARRVVAEALARVTPQNAVLVTGLEPVYLEPFVLRGTQRRIVPVCREVEYASKAVAWKRIAELDPPARGPLDHRAPGLFRGGAKDVVAFTADERPEQLAAWVREGVPVYFEAFFYVQCSPLARLAELGIGAEPIAGLKGIARLVPRRAQ